MKKMMVFISLFISFISNPNKINKNKNKKAETEEIEEEEEEEEEEDVEEEEVPKRRENQEDNKIKSLFGTSFPVTIPSQFSHVSNFEELGSDEDNENVLSFSFLKFKSKVK